MEDPSSAWLRAAIHQAYSVAAQTSAFSFSTASPLLNDDDTISVNEDFDPDPGNDPGKDPRFRKLVEAVLFSRAFMNTYNIVLLVILLGFTIAQWGGVMQRAYRRRAAARRAKKQNGYTSGARTAQGRKTVAAGAEESGASSSSSSTLEGTATPPDVPKVNTNKTPDERQPLLPRDGSKVRKTGVLAFVLHRIKAWLMYQPRPIPVINKELPSNGQTLVILAFLGLNIFYLFFRIEFTPEHIFVFADRCGILIAINLPLLYLFAAKNQPITWLTGYSYESLNIFHRRLGELLCLSAFLHGLGMFAVWYGLLRKLGFTLGRFVFSRVVFFGLLAFVCYELLYITSLRTLRVRCYELFLTLHVVLQAFALVFLFIHHSRSRIWVGIALLIFVIDRFIYRLGIKSTYLRADLSILPDGQTVRLSSNWSIPPGTWTTQLTRRTVLRGWNAPDHVFISIPALGSPHALQAHPFTVATPAPSKPRVLHHPSNEEERHAWLSLLVRAQGGFSRDLLRHAQTNSSTLVRLDGPYGSTHPLALLRSVDCAIVVAGGSGVAVAFPLLWTLLNPAAKPDLERQTRGVAAGTGVAGGNYRPRKVCFLWVVRKTSHREWLPEQRLEELRQWGADLRVEGPTESVGRPDVRGILEEWVGLYGDAGRSTGCVVSGPDALNRDVRNACAGLVRDGRGVSVSVEKFGW